MKYFILNMNPNYTTAPQILDASEEIQKRDITLKRSANIKKRTLFYIRSSANTVYTDVINHPFFLISEKMFKIARKYDPTIVSKQIILLDKDSQEAKLYYMPILPRIDCISEKSELNRSRREFIRPVIVPHNARGRNIFWLKNFESNLPVITLDLAESFLRRDVKGISLTLMELE